MICNYITSPENFLQAISLLKTPSSKLILDFLLFLNSKYDLVDVSQEALGKYAGITREHCNRLIKELCLQGLLKKKKRYNDTSLYEINPLFYHLKDKIKHIFRSLNLFSLKLLKSIQKEYITSYILNIYSLSLRASASYTENITIRQNINEEKEGNSKLVENQEICVEKKEAGAGAFGKRVNKMESVVISPVLRKITNDLHLTKWGQLKLLVFENDILEQVHAILLTKTGINNPFAWFFGMAKKLSEERKKDINWDIYYRFKEQYQMPENPNYTFTKKAPAPYEKPKKPERPIESTYIPNSEETKAETAKNRTTFDYVKAYCDFEDNRKAGNFDELERKLGMKMKNPYEATLKEMGMLPSDNPPPVPAVNNMDIFTLVL